MNRGNLFNLLKTNNNGAFLALIVFSLVTLKFNIYLGVIEIITVLVLFSTHRFFNFKRRRKLNEYLEDLFLSSDSISKDFVVNSMLPLAILKDEDTIIWYNNAFSDAFYDDGPAETSLKAVIKGFPNLKSNEENREINTNIKYEDKTYNVLGTHLKIPHHENKFYTLIYFIDITKEVFYKKELEDKELVMAHIVIDNYEEAISGLSESQRAVLIADTDKYIYSWAQNTNAVIKKQEKDQYNLYFHKKLLDNYLKKDFEKLRDFTIKDNENVINLTFSVGVGHGGETPADNEEFCSSAIDMALGRGGDQIVVKDPDGFKFFGGASKETEKRSKVRSRVVAHALKELMESKENIVVMGHTDTDMDALGSALGVVRAAKSVNKNAYILIDDVNPSVKEIVEQMDAMDEYKDIIIDYYRAEELLDDMGMLVLVDAHRRVLFPYKELIEKAQTTVLIDHHRKSPDFIDSLTLTYHEPYASSTSELVIEILQYMDQKIKLTPIEAKALYAGMLIDTKNFTFKTGVRTFEAASFLRRSGLDTTEAKELVKCDLKTYKIRSEIINDAIIYRDSIAISKYVGEEIGDLTVIAQAADELINIKGINTTFVIYFDGECCRISARSVGNINVQVIMEKMGGGGHQLSAGAKVESTNINEVMDELVKNIDEILG
ncbi:MAG: DHH family phosphoesterase [Clostridia bacterium]|nr:DHH family phosphoesterase [Clostridia bacterium]